MAITAGSERMGKKYSQKMGYGVTRGQNVIVVQGDAHRVCYCSASRTDWSTSHSAYVGAGSLVGRGRPGMGAASADALYGCIAGFGLAALAGLLLAWQTELQIGGGLFLLYLGGQTWRTPPVMAQAQVQPTRAGLLGDYLSTLALTLTNPVTIRRFWGFSPDWDWRRSSGILPPLDGWYREFFWIAAVVAAAGRDGGLGARTLDAHPAWAGLTVSGALIAGFGGWALGTAFWR